MEHTFPEIAYMTKEFSIQKEKLEVNLRYLEGTGETKHRRVCDTNQSM